MKNHNSNLNLKTIKILKKKVNLKDIKIIKIQALVKKRMRIFMDNAEKNNTIKKAIVKNGNFNIILHSKIMRNEIKVVVKIKIINKNRLLPNLDLVKKIPKKEKDKKKINEASFQKQMKKKSKIFKVLQRISKIK